MNYVIDLIEKGTKRRSGIPIKKVRFIVAHDTGNDGSTAKNNVDYYKRTANEAFASAHIFVDDKEARMCINSFEYAEIAYHVRRDVLLDNERFGIDSIDGAIGVELCYFSNDYARSLIAYRNYVKTIVDLFIFHKIPVDNILGHFELDGSRRSDPNNALRYINKNFDILKQDIKKEYDKIMSESNVSEWAKEAWEWAKSVGINDGAGSKNVVTEEQLMVFLKRFYDKLKIKI